MYWREYRTEFHIGVSDGISELAACRTIKKIEDALIESEIFHLSGGKNVSCRSDLKTVLIDASEQPVERPKKIVSLITAERKNASLKKFKQLLILRQEKFFLLIFAMEERMISDCSRKTELMFNLMSLFLRMPEIRELQKFTKTAEFRSKGKRIVL